MIRGPSGDLRPVKAVVSTPRPLLGAEVAPQKRSDPPEHLGELLALPDSESLRHALLDASRRLIGAEHQGLTLGRE